jgi:hypothetical protein
MKQQFRSGLLALLLANLTLLAAAQTGARQTALDRYIAQKDAVYGWKLVKTIEGQGCKPGAAKRR